MTKKFLQILSVFILVVGGGWGLLMYYFIPEWWFAAYPVIPLTFLLIGLLEIFLVHRRGGNGHKVLNSMLIQRLIRWSFVLTVLILLIKMAQLPRVSFIVSFMMMYMIYAVIEIVFVSRIVKKKDAKDK